VAEAVKRRPDLLDLTALLWGGILVGLAIFGFFFPWSHNVYGVYTHAGRCWWAGEDLYFCRTTDFFRYSPVFAVGMTPFAFLPDGWGNALWRLFNSAVFVLGLASWIRCAIPGEASRVRTAALLLLVLPTSLHSLYNAQANLLMVGAVLFGLTAVLRTQWNRAAAWIALATLVKGYPLALGLLLMAFYPRRFSHRFLAALAVGLLLPFVAQSPGIVTAQYQSWAHHLQESTVIMRERLRSFDHLVSLWGHAIAPGKLLLMELLAGFGVLALCSLHRQRVRDPRQRLLLTMQLFATWVALFGPATESCTYVVIAPAIAWALWDAFHREGAWPARIVLVLSLLLMGPVTTDLAGPWLRGIANEHGSQPVGALVLLGYLVIRVVRLAARPEADQVSTIAPSLHAAA
jgi:Glycosyltransferase family 87